MPGPLPNPNKRRRNAPTISGTDLPAKGRTGPIPVCPYELDVRGMAWWDWAWRLPQATRWDVGSLYFVARRAQLEDHVEELSPSLWKEMRELDNRLGLNPQAMLALRWSIAGEEEVAAGGHLAAVKPFEPPKKKAS